MPEFMAATAGVTLLVLLSLEAYTYSYEAATSRVQARWMALMWLSIVWGVYGGCALAIGFWRRVRPLRLAALGLFGVTGVKLVLVDMATVKQMYRIVSFIALGLLMIGVSYLYHRVEASLEDDSSEEG